VRGAECDAVTILINMTYFSLNTSIYLASVIEVLPALINVFDQAPNEVMWLLSHLLNDAKVDSKQLVTCRLIARINGQIERLDVSRCC